MKVTSTVVSCTFNYLKVPSLAVIIQFLHIEVSEVYYHIPNQIVSILAPEMI